MSVIVEISNPANLERVRSLLGAKSDAEAADLALEKVIEVYEPREYEPKEREETTSVLDEEYWEDLFSDPPVPSRVIDRMISSEREDRF